MSFSSKLPVICAIALFPAVAIADPSLECSLSSGSQVEIGNCVAEAEATIEKTLALALGFATDSAKSLDEATGRPMATPALEAGQAAWAAYRDAHCDFVGTTFGGGSGAGIAIQSCRVELGRARIEELLSYAQ
ncbi:lysozyme inhibitor LprI family protein [Thioclava sp. FR2]|uniref:lysozyme inhibitor LprI family protein n=1 Tax=Thioclava sp. FR2 TaxID=3445780 RepID=UPI003EB9284C